METMYLSYFTQDENFPFFIQYGNHDKDLSMHTHADFSELVIVLSGTAAHIVDNQQFYIKKGDVFVISNDTAHGYKSTDDFCICNIMYRSSDLFTIVSDIKKSPGFHALFVLEPYLSKDHSFESRLKLDVLEFEKISAIITQLINEYQKKDEGWQTFVHANFITLVVLLSRLYTMNEHIKSSDIINIAKPVSYIENHYTEQISIEVLAKMAHFSPRHFTRIFSETYHTTPYNYIKLLRIHHACTLLKRTSLSISNIALESGYNDSNYFSRLFRDCIGTTPKEYRANHSPLVKEDTF